MTEFNGYKLKPVDYTFQVGDILIRVIKNGDEGELALVTYSTPKGNTEISNSSKTKYIIANHCWKAIATLPGSQAKAGDTVYCISDTEGSCQQHDSFKVKSVTTDAIYAEPGQKLLNAETTRGAWNWPKEHFVVLVKAEQPKYELNEPSGYYAQNYPLYYVTCSNMVNKQLGILAKNGTIIFPEYGSDTHLTQCCWPTRAEALAARAKYLGESVQPEIKVGSYWSFIDDNTSIIKVVEVDSAKTIKYKPMRDITYYADSKWFLRHYRPRPDLDNQTPEQSENSINQQMEKQMPNFNLTLLIQFLAQSAEEKVDATNAKHIGILAESDGTYTGYVYANTIKELQDIVRKPENEGRKLHIFDYNQTIAQKARPVTQVSRV